MREHHSLRHHKQHALSVSEAITKIQVEINQAELALEYQKRYLSYLANFLSDIQREGLLHNMNEAYQCLIRIGVVTLRALVEPRVHQPEPRIIQTTLCEEIVLPMDPYSPCGLRQKLGITRREISENTWCFTLRYMPLLVLIEKSEVLKTDTLWRKTLRTVTKAGEMMQDFTDLNQFAQFDEILPLDITQEESADVNGIK